MKKYFVVISLISMLCMITACGTSSTSKQEGVTPGIETATPSKGAEKELTALIEKYFAAAQKDEVDKVFPNLPDDMRIYGKKLKNYTIDNMYQYSTRTASQEEEWREWIEEMEDDLGIKFEDDVAEAQVRVTFEDGEESYYGFLFQKQNNSWEFIFIDDTWSFGY